MRWKLGVGALVLIAISWFAWLHDHDKKVAMRAHLKELEVTAHKKDEQILGFKTSLDLMNKEYTKLRAAYVVRKKINEDSVASLQKQIDWWSNQVRAMMPDSAKHLVDDIQAACKGQVELEKKNTTSCEVNLAHADSILAKKDTIIWGLTDARDYYSNMYDLTKGYSPSGGMWATVGKVETGVGIIGLITKFFGLW